MSLDEAEQLREVSRAVFGQAHLLGVAVAFRRSSDPLSATDLVPALGVTHATSLEAPLGRLVTGGFLQPVEGSPSDRARRYRAVDSSFWVLVDELYERATAQGTLFE